MSARTDRAPLAVLFVALAAYLVSLFFPWWNESQRFGHWSISGIGSGGTFTQLAILLAFAILMLSIKELRSQGDRLLLLRRQLAIAFVVFNALAAFELWRAGSLDAPKGDHDHLGAAAYCAVAASVFVLIALQRLVTGDRSESVRGWEAETTSVSGEGKLWRRIAIAAALIYALAIFSPWSTTDYHDGLVRALPFLGRYGHWSTDLGLISLILCYLILVFALLPPRLSALSLVRRRTTLALGLLGLTVVSIFVLIPSGNTDSYGFWPRQFGMVGYGAWLALSSSLALLLAVAALGAGGFGALLERAPAWVRLDRLATEETGAAKRESETSPRERRWMLMLEFALVAYALTIRMSWWTCRSVIPFGTTYTRVAVPPLFFGRAELCTALAIGVLIFVLATRTNRARWVGQARTGLIATLVGLSVFSFFMTWDGVGWFNGARPDYGLYVALASLLTMVVAASALNGGPSLVAILRSRGLKSGGERGMRDGEIDRSRRREDVFPHAVLFVSSVTYLVALFFSGWNNQFPFVMLETRWAEFGAVLAIAMMVLSAPALASKEPGLLQARLYLPIALIVVTLLAIIELWRTTVESGSASEGHPGPGGIVALGCSLAILWAVLVIDFGGAGRLIGLGARKNPEPN